MLELLHCPSDDVASYNVDGRACFTANRIDLPQLPLATVRSMTISHHQLLGFSTRLHSLLLCCCCLFSSQQRVFFCYFAASWLTGDTDTGREWWILSSRLAEVAGRWLPCSNAPTALHGLISSARLSHINRFPPDGNEYPFSSGQFCRFWLNDRRLDRAHKDGSDELANPHKHVRTRGSLSVKTTRPTVTVRLASFISPPQNSYWTGQTYNSWPILWRVCRCV